MDDRSVNAMDLIQQLENKVRDKNNIIEDLKEETSQWRLKFILVTCFGYQHPGVMGMMNFLVGLVLGGGIGGGIMFWVRGHM